MIDDEKKIKKINENLIDEVIKKNEEKKINTIIDENNNKLKMIRCKEFHIKSNDNIKDKERNKVIKIILNKKKAIRNK